MDYQKTVRVDDTLPVYVNQALNIIGLVDPYQFYYFTEELSAEEYLLLDYLIYQGMNLHEASTKLEVSIYKGKCLLECISNKAKVFVTERTIVIDYDESYEYKHYSQVA